MVGAHRVQICEVLSSLESKDVEAWVSVTCCGAASDLREGVPFAGEYRGEYQVHLRDFPVFLLYCYPFRL